MADILWLYVAFGAIFVVVLQNGSNASKINAVREDIKTIKKHLGIVDEEG